MRRGALMERVAERRTQAERRALSEQRLLDAAIELIAEKGSTRATLAEIGERAGYSRGLAGQRFGSKRELVERLTQHLQRRFLDETVHPALHGATGLGALLAVVDTCVGELAHADDAARAFYVLLGESLGPVPEIRATLALSNREFRAFIETEMKRGIEAGEIRPDVDVACQTKILVGALRGIALQWLVDPDSLDLARLRDEMHRSVERTLRTPRD